MEKIKMKKYFSLGLKIFFALIIVVSFAYKDHAYNIARYTGACAGRAFYSVCDPYKKKKKTVYTGYQKNFQDYCGDNVNLSPDLEIVKYLNTDTVLYPDAERFDYQPYAEPKLTLLREKYNLKRLADDCKTDLEVFANVMDWVRNRFACGAPSYKIDYNFNALDILSRGEAGEKFCCSEYSTVLVQCLASLGYTARYIGLDQNHVMVEAYSNDYVRWVTLDVSNNCYYMEEDKLLAAWQINALCAAGLADTINIISRKIMVDDRNTSYSRKDMQMKFSRGYYIRMRNDWFSNRYPHWHPKANSIMNSLRWNNGDGNSAKSSQYYYPLNFTAGCIVDLVDNKARLRLNTFTPNFSHFKIKINNKMYESDKYDFYCEMREGINIIEVRSVNQAMVAGPALSITLCRKK